MRLQKIGFSCGILAPVLWLTLICLTGAMRPEYSHIAQYISELGEKGSNTEKLMRYAGFEVTGFLYLVFASALWTSFGNHWLRLAASLIALDGIWRIGAGIFPCDPGCVGLSIGQHLHHDFATFGFLSGVCSAIICGIAFRRIHLSRYLSWYSIGSGVFALSFLLLMSWQDNPIKSPGLFEHLATLLLSVWLLVFAVYCLRRRS